MTFMTPAERNRLEMEKARPKSSLPPPLSAKEEAEIKALFVELDADGSGELDAEEIEQVLLRMGRPLSTRALAEAMEEMDLDGSGDVDFQEFRAWYIDQKRGTNSKHAMMVLEKSRKRFSGQHLPKNWRGPRWHGPLSAAEQDNAERAAAAATETPGAPKIPALEEAQLRSLFNEFDEDGSGDLSEVEINKLARRMGHRMTSLELEQAMAEMDEDRSGEIDFTEFKNWWACSKSGSKLNAAVADTARKKYT
eukprot:SAG22_NODE_5718_length_965_cov_1.461894_1_plen_250_part_10